MTSTQARFGAAFLHTVSLEEGFQRIDASTRELAPAIEAVLGAASAGPERIGPELFQDCVEMRTPVYTTFAQLDRKLPALRHEVLGPAPNRLTSARPMSPVDPGRPVSTRTHG